MKQILDVECYPNFFCIGIKDYDSKETILFEISEERNNLEQIKQ